MRLFTLKFSVKLGCLYLASLLSSVAFAASEAKNQYITAPIQGHMTVEQESIVSPEDSLFIVKNDEKSVEILVVTYFKGKSIAGTHIDTPKEYRQFATGLFQGAGKGYKLTAAQIASEMSWGEWSVYLFNTKIDLEGNIQDADAYAMVHNTGEIVFAIHMMPQGREELENGAMSNILKGLALN